MNLVSSDCFVAWADGCMWYGTADEVAPWAARAGESIVVRVEVAEEGKPDTNQSIVTVFRVPDGEDAAQYAEDMADRVRHRLILQHEVRVADYEAATGPRKNDLAQQLAARGTDGEIVAG